MMRSRRSRRLRLRLKWLVAAAAALSMLLFIVKSLYSQGLTWARSGRLIGIQSGDLLLGYDPTCPDGLVEHGHDPYYWAPAAGSSVASIPLWPFEAAFFPLAFAAAWLFWKDMRYHIPGLCPKCGYDMTGLADGPCPECGASND